MSIGNELAIEGAKATPAASVLIAKASGVQFTTENLTTYLAILWLIMQIGWFAWEKWIKPFIEKRNGRRRS